MEYVIHIVVLASIFSVLAISLDLLAGHIGFLPMSHAAFYGLGAYTSALLTIHFGGSFVLGVMAGMATAVVISLFISLPSLRLHDDYFVIATFGFQMILFSVFNNWIRLTRGPQGIPDIPPPVILGWRVDTPTGFLVLALGFAVVAHLVAWRLASSPFGRVLHAVREDELFAKALGKNTLRFKVLAFSVSAAIAASAGSLYAHYVTYIDPTSFTALESIMIIAMVIVGGAGSRWGALVGAALLVVLPEVLRFIGMPSELAANLRQVIFGALLVIMMLFRPHGLVGKFDFSR